MVNVPNEMTGRMGPTSSQQAGRETQQFLREEKMAHARWVEKIRMKKNEGTVDAERIIARARAKGNKRLVHAALVFAAAQAAVEVKQQEAKLEMMRAQMLVDVLSIIDPTPMTFGVSIWMDIQRAYTP